MVSLGGCDEMSNKRYCQVSVVQAVRLRVVVLPVNQGQGVALFPGCPLERRDVPMLV
jgi:hypothetical protein